MCLVLDRGDPELLVVFGSIEPAVTHQREAFGDEDNASRYDPVDVFHRHAASLADG